MISSFAWFKFPVVSSSSLLLSKFTSENTGMSNDGMLEKVSSNEMSKSSGIGNSSDVNVDSLVVVSELFSGMFVESGFFSSVFPASLGMYAANKSACFIARINCGRSSSGRSDGMFGAVSVEAGTASVAVSGSGVFLGAIFGNGMVISGFFVRMISVVVATYKGSIAKIKIPNTKPGKPRSCACINLCHCVPLKMLK